MRLAILGTGSSGNSIYIEDDKNKILIDAGFSGKKIKEKLEEIGRDINDVQGIFISHEHGDHILGAGILARKYKIPIYIARESYNPISERLGNIPMGLLNFIDGPMKFGNLYIKFIDVSHDAERTLAFKIENSLGKKIGIATDIGRVNNILKYDFNDLDLLVMESNYDFNMLMECSYPMNLKMRVKSNKGHLANKDTGRFIADIYQERLKKVYLAHISRDSNCPKIARKTVLEELYRKGIESLEVEAVPQGVYTKLYEIE